MTKLADVLTEHEINFHIYADKTQLWFPFEKPEENLIRERIPEIFYIIHEFMLNHHLKLNTTKTVFLPISGKPQIFLPLRLATDCTVQPSSCTTNLGVLFDI